MNGFLQQQLFVGIVLESEASDSDCGIEVLGELVAQLNDSNKQLAPLPYGHGLEALFEAISPCIFGLSRPLGKAFSWPLGRHLIKVAAGSNTYK